MSVARITEADFSPAMRSALGRLRAEVKAGKRLDLAIQVVAKQTGFLAHELQVAWRLVGADRSLGKPQT